ncbi:hypothetical protein BASA50_000708 [Batrachochytrium salamandrivorans]|uniref:FRG1-like family protein n=1 Tax=Batrachochytrium salamandrivorans TaxID=1357716 RepID=A0ABQ8EUE7_9FUNG|nr:hypothetical protein BASA50_000708 [Batrachochytrium salamandrivorans]
MQLCVLIILTTCTASWGQVSSKHTKSKKRRHHDKNDDADKRGKSKSRRDIQEPAEGWIVCTTIEDVMGPVIFATSTLDPPSLLYKHQKTSKMTFAHLPTDVPRSAADDHPGADQEHLASTADDTPTVSTTMATIEPLSAIQVFIANRFPGSSKTTFKSAQDTYLASDKYGVVTCDMEAAGPAEEWDLILREDGFALQNMHGMFLSSVPEDASVRADADSIGFKQVFTIKCQASIKQAAARRDKEAASNGMSIGPGGIASLELEQLRRFQSYGERHVGLLEQDKQSLLKASRQGTINEELLNRRSKVKSDKFCK